MRNGILAVGFYVAFFGTITFVLGRSSLVTLMDDPHFIVAAYFGTSAQEFPQIGTYEAMLNFGLMVALIGAIMILYGIKANPRKRTPSRRIRGKSLSPSKGRRKKTA